MEVLESATCFLDDAAQLRTSPYSLRGQRPEIPSFPQPGLPKTGHGDPEVCLQLQKNDRFGTSIDPVTNFQLQLIGNMR